MFTTRDKRSMRIIVPSLILALLLVALTAVPAFADNGKNCWGVVTSQRASTYHNVGQHASEQGEPRAGLGNLARALGFDHISEMGSFLAEVDGLDATQCR